MTAQQQTCFTLSCDACGQFYDDGEGRELHFESAEAIRFDAVNCCDWSWNEADGCDFCPSCTCDREGHRRRVIGVVVVCARCYEEITTTRTPKEAYL